MTTWVASVLKLANYLNLDITDINNEFAFDDKKTNQIHLLMVYNLHNIQIKICAEYWDMLPRPRLVCQEPGLRPICRSPGVSDKSSRGLGSMSRYSAQILICFIAYILQFFFTPLWVWLGTLQD